ncbi:TraR/DksA family transcriptional regulator [Oceanidesulfovibrio marinus]|uniref:TraR/DksA family transcriptional regulator n=1 Tax=Oceanidesulfovibrio marinus TaxID=370038 RepID=A0A6P1ZLE8_9BACT|nr:TraR/DksA C4-type zinc finger protein [Oceanidesulfovibrio marinus]QJT08955.1 TraR/DksA family transcriptional regulator [Oceanidesulfovibrio marinus]TVM36626.1 TraR/DksA family transcriptional regulator [Oceanidesulfovibrio marinus]
MTPDQLSEIKKHLQSELEALEAQELDLTVEYCADENEFASVVSDTHIKMAMRERSWARTKEIQTALRRVDAADYGCCEECGGDIGTARLKARPTTMLCVDCQSALEQQPVRYAV